MTSSTRIDDVTAFYNRLVFLWTNNETSKTQFGFQTKNILDALGGAMAATEKGRSIIMSQEQSRFGRMAAELTARQSKGDITPRECLHEGLLLFFDSIAPRMAGCQDYHRECQFFGDHVTPENHDESSLILMLKRNRI